MMIAMSIKPPRTCIALSLALLCMLVPSPSQAAEVLPQGFVYLRDVDPSIPQDMRYAGSDNFTGHPVPGYDAPECILASEAAKALARVQNALESQGLSLKVYDCYRPGRAVQAFVDWARSPAPDPDPSKNAHYPGLTRPELLAQEYITAPSGHSLGTAVDLTIIPASSNAPPAGAPASPSPAQPDGGGVCTAPRAERPPDNSVDMGTGFDCFAVLSHTANPSITPEQRRWRSTLVDAMAAQGFQNYPKEWWHFSIPLKGYDKHRDFPIEPRPSGE